MPLAAVAVRVTVPAWVSVVGFATAVTVGAISLTILAIVLVKLLADGTAVVIAVVRDDAVGCSEVGTD